MLIDISAHLRRLVLAGLPFVGACAIGEGRSGFGDGQATPVDHVSRVDACVSRALIPSPAGADWRHSVNLRFDPGDPRWADFYQSCLSSGDFCQQLCNTLLQAAPQQSPFSVQECTLTCDGSGATVAAIRGNDFPSLPSPGRRPEGFAATFLMGPGTTLGDLCAQAAVLEAASIPAFVTLAAELGHHGAPAALVSRARTAASDEERHYQIMRALARRHGRTDVARPQVPRRERPRDLETVAIENAREGCAGETHAAGLATWQAQRAADPELRVAMRQISVDEQSHAQLAWDVDHWAAGHLDSAQRARVRAARRERGMSLVLGSQAPVDAGLVHAAGIPEPRAALALSAAQYLSLWS